jgi:dihydrodipicolinate synthase/N-acetylneuraminate lyase
MKGLFIPQLTAFNKNQRVDYVATKEHGAWLLENGAYGLVPFGTFGEGSALSLSEKKRITNDLLTISNGKLFIPTVISNSLEEICEYIEFANNLPIHAVMISPPSYFRPISDEKMIEFYRFICQKSLHPVIAYSIPATALRVPSSVVSNSPVWGVKDSSGDIALATEFLQDKVKVLIGTDRLLVDALKLGAAGGICGLGNLFPARMASVYRSFAGGKIEESEETLATVLNFTSRFLRPEFGFRESIAAAKAVSNLINPINLGEMRLPSASYELPEQLKSELIALAKE